LTRGQAFLAGLRAGEVLVSDGATGTFLQSMGLAPGAAPESWVVEQPEQIRALHRSYVEAGSDVILACSFGGTRYRLARHGLAGRVEEVNRRAAELAREVAGDRAFVAGDIGPTGELLAPLGKVTREELTDAFAQQAAGLAEGLVDFLVIETMSDLGEAEAAINGIRRVTGLPIICTFSFDTHGRTMMGVRPEQAARTIGPLVEGIGANCGRDPAEYEGIIQDMRRAQPQAILWAKPNAGLPRAEGGQAVYDATPGYMAEIALQLRAAGAHVIGGCCGTTPQHIAAMAAAIEDSRTATTEAK
jgi:5-methyltetrahydrofolate--homocysteine methyltransferase